MGWLRVELEVEDDDMCPMTSHSDTSHPAKLISRTVPATTDSVVVEAIITDASTDLNGEGVELVFTDGEHSVYHLRRDYHTGCPCELFDQAGIPLLDVTATGSRMHFEFHIRDAAEFKNLLAALRERFHHVSVHSIVRSTDLTDPHNFVLFDMETLTNRQKEVLELAYTMGYFDYPKRANLNEVSAVLDINNSTVSQHLTNAQAKLLDSMFGDRETDTGSQT
jgi:predicted DNA binding protein